MKKIYYQVPLTAFSIQLSNDCNVEYINPAGTLAAGTFTLPQSPTHSQELILISTQIVTSLTMTAGAGQTIIGGATSMAANTVAGRWCFYAPTATWIPI